MSKLTDTKHAYDKLARLLDVEMQSRKGNLQELERFRQTLDVAFYLLGWAQFEYRIRAESKEIVEQNSRAKTKDGYAWRFLQENLKEYPVRKRLDLIFHGKPKILSALNKDYTVRNDAADDYKNLPAEAKDVSNWLAHLEGLLDEFDT